MGPLAYQHSPWVHQLQLVVCAIPHQSLVQMAQVLKRVTAHSTHKLIMQCEAHSAGHRQGFCRHSLYKVRDQTSAAFVALLSLHFWHPQLCITNDVIMNSGIVLITT